MGKFETRGKKKTAEETGINTLEILLLEEISHLSKKNGYCHASKKYLSEILCCSQADMYRMLNNIEGRKLITREGKKIYPNKKLIDGICGELLEKEISVTVPFKHMILRKISKEKMLNLAEQIESELPEEYL